MEAGEYGHGQASMMLYTNNTKEKNLGGGGKPENPIYHMLI